MIVEIKVPELGESINEVEIGEWLVEVGDRVRADDEIVALESEKATVEVPAPAGGSLVKILKQQGESAAIGEIIGHIETAGDGDEEAAPTAKPDEKDDAVTGDSDAEQREPRERLREDAPADSGEKGEEASAEETPKVMPAAARVLAQHDIAPETVQPTGPGGRILKEDALRAVDDRASAGKKGEKQPPSGRQPEGEAAGQREHRVAMTPIRRTIAARLVDAQQNMALLTTFNEADMTEVKSTRTVFGREFEAKHGVKLGFMSFFVKAAVAALNDFPLVNARIDGKDIVYHDNCDIGVAIGGGKGLVVPILRRAERMSFAGIEKKIGELAEKAKENSLTMDELQGGTFTISNGGIYGSMLSTPIVNPPQSAILGLHAITDRPVAIDGEIRIRPIMYLALSYDHRIIDGREAVSFLKSIKARIEEPRKLLLEI
ncbi:2-oxoglutarate dehydrogenase complex dihydrolipoyllysine-residue succinyltransferase [Desulfocastanea catecholica]